MFLRILDALRDFASADQPRRSGGHGRPLRLEPLERRELLAVTLLDEISVTSSSADKPQSKVWTHDDHWWTVMPRDSGAWVWKLQGTAWSPHLQISDDSSVRADVKADGDLTHVLLYDGVYSELATLQYDDDRDAYAPWSLRPELVDVVLSGGVESASVDVDSTGRMWVVSDTGSTVQVRYSDGLYTQWSSPITVGAGISSDDIAAITTLGGDSIAVMWSNQNTRRFHLRIHHDNAAPNDWTATEVAAGQSALNVGAGMADDHLNLATGSDGTLYAAVKTGYDSGSRPEIALLVRRPDGVWEDLIPIDTRGTRPIVVLSEGADRLTVAYTSSDFGGSIRYREASTQNLAFGSVATLIPGGNLNNVSSTKQTLDDAAVFLAVGGSRMSSALLADDPIVIQPPVVDPPVDDPPAEDPEQPPVAAVFQQGLNGYQGARDTKIKAEQAGINYGTDTRMEVDGDPDQAVLLGWDLSSIDAGSTIVSARVTLDIVNRSGDAYPLYAIERAWQETQATWEVASAGQSWASAGADGVADRGRSSLGTLRPTGLGLTHVELNAQGIAQLQRWVDDPATNNGFVLQNYHDAGNGADFRSKEDADVTRRPKLTVVYRPAAEETPEPDPDPTDDPPMPSPNLPPTVNAGVDQRIVEGAEATLLGVAADDGLPGDGLSVAWSVTSGPASVAFGDRFEATTTARFSTPGAYVLRLTAHDGEATRFDELIVDVVAPTSGETTVELQDGINGYAGTRDTKIKRSRPTTNYGNATTLETDGDPDQGVLLAWDLSQIPIGSRVVDVQMTLNITNGSPQSYAIRPLSTAWEEHAATWQVASASTPWVSAGARDLDAGQLGVVAQDRLGRFTIQLDQEGRNIVQNWIDMPGTNHGVIIENYDSASNGLDFSSREAAVVVRRPKLSITYVAPGSSDEPAEQPAPNATPSVAAGDDQTIAWGDVATLVGVATDDGLPDGTLAVRWSVDAGPGAVVFAEADRGQTTATFASAGEYTLRLTATDGLATEFDTVRVTVNPPPAPTPDPDPEPDPVPAPTPDPDPEPDPIPDPQPDPPSDPPPSADPTPTLVGHWALDDILAQTTPDLSGSGNDATVVGNPTPISSPTGSGLRLTSDRLEIAADASLSPTDQITLAAWIAPEKQGTQDVIKKGKYGAVDGYELSLSTNGKAFVRFNQKSSGNSYRLDAAENYPTNGRDWMHLAAVYDGQTIRLYVNGELSATKQAVFTIATNERPLSLGGQDDGTRTLRGGLDEVRIYNEALPPEAIRELYEGA